MKAIKLPNGCIPKNPGEYSLQPNVYRPPFGGRVEIFMMTPLGNVGALIPENHTWSFNELGYLTVNPSIVYFNYHGWLINDMWSE